MDDCIFCRIVRGEIPSRKVYEDADTLAFHDLSPQAPVHVLIIPKRHTENILTASAQDDQLPARLFKATAEVAKALGIEKTGFRIVTNCGEHGCQSVPHLHIHMLGGAQLSGAMA